jgi:hypothetical protein
MKFNKMLKSSVIGTFLMAPVLAMAWGAIASSSVTGTHTATNYGSAAEAEKAAIEGCEKMGRPCTIMVKARNGGAFVLYEGEGGYYGTFATDPAEANKLAKANCSKKNKSCEIRTAAWDGGARWLAVAVSEAGYKVRYNYPDPKAAQEEAMADCLNNSSAPETCKLLDEAAFKGSVAIATSDSAKRYFIQVDQDPKSAASQALANCAASPSKPLDCKVTEQFTNDAPLPIPKAMKALQAQAEKNQAAAKRVKEQAPAKSVRSTTKTTEQYSCETVCQNASCVSRFPDGTVLRWTAQMKHDGFKWALDTSGCGR